MWAEPAYARGLRRAAGLGRVVVFDPSGLGLSDPVDHVPTLEEQADDVRTVMDAAGIERATLFATMFSTGGVVMFATQEPERAQLGPSDRLVLAAARHAPRLVRALQRT